MPTKAQTLILNLTYENNGYGNFIIKKKLFEEVNGFNEYIYGWGYDDFDFHNRVMELTGSQKRGEDFITVKKHGASKSFDQQLDNKKLFSALKLAHHKKNRYISKNTNLPKYVRWNSCLKFTTLSKFVYITNTVNRCVVTGRKKK